MGATTPSPSGSKNREADGTDSSTEAGDGTSPGLVVEAGVVVVAGPVVVRLSRRSDAVTLPIAESTRTVGKLLTLLMLAPSLSLLLLLLRPLLKGVG